MSGLNPKVFLLFLALLPQFTNSNASWPLWWQIVVLGLVHTASCAAVYTGVGAGARTLLGTRPRAARIVTRVSGVAMIGIGGIPARRTTDAHHPACDCRCEASPGDVDSGEECEASNMGIEQWWPSLRPSTREWLIAHNGEALPAEIAAEIGDAGGAVAPDASSAAESGATGSFLQDDAIDWIEAVANEEGPGAGAD